MSPVINTNKKLLTYCYVSKIQHDYENFLYISFVSVMISVKLKTFLVTFVFKFCIIPDPYIF